MKCPCHSNKPYDTCCKPYHEGNLPEGVVELMRSRYSAYALCNAHYIMQTTHPAHADFTLDQTHWRSSIEEFCNYTQFIDLEILDSTINTVTFHATLKQGEDDLSFTEKSLFEKIGERILYRSGSKA